MNLKTIQNLEIDNKTALLRVNFDVPQTDGKILDDTRINNSFETIRYLLSKNCKVIILSHLGRPKGSITPQLSLKSVAFKLQEMIPYTKVNFSTEIFGLTTQEFIKNMRNAEILLLENLRFDPHEEENSEEFAKMLAGLGDFYVNEAFAVSHRKHASIVGIPKFLPSSAGFAFLREVETLSLLKQNAQKPIVIILGGKKQDKLRFTETFSNWADQILIGGLLPRIIGKEGQVNGKVTFAALTADGKDITLESSDKFKEIIIGGKTIVWNGTMDLFEDRHNQAGTRIIASSIVEANAKRYAGGGDTTSAIKQLNLTDKFDYISSGGGAMLEMLAFGKIAGMEALQTKNE